MAIFARGKARRIGLAHDGLHLVRSVAVGAVEIFVVRIRFGSGDVVVATVAARVDRRDIGTHVVEAVTGTAFDDLAGLEM